MYIVNVERLFLFFRGVMILRKIEVKNFKCWKVSKVRFYDEKLFCVIDIKEEIFFIGRGLRFEE